MTWADKVVIRILCIIANIVEPRYKSEIDALCNHIQVWGKEGSE